MLTSLSDSRNKQLFYVQFKQPVERVKDFGLVAATHSVVDPEILRRGFSFTKTLAQLELKAKQKKVITSFLSHFSLTETSLATRSTPKPTY